MHQVKIFSRSICVFAILMISACGGSEDTTLSAGDTVATPVAYSSSTEQAVLDDTNSQEIAAAGFEGSLAPFDVFFDQAQSQTAIDNGAFSRHAVIKALAQKVDQNIRDASSVSASTSFASLSGSLATGNCAGSHENRVSFDGSTMTFSGAIVYASYCEQELTLNGTINVSGNYYLNSDKAIIMDLTIDFDGFSIADDQQSFTMKGSINYSNSLAPNVNSIPILHNITMELLLRNDNTSKVYWYNDISLEYFKNGIIEPLQDASTIKISGRFYHPDHGYAEISTPFYGSMRLLESDLWPYLGYLEFMGANSSMATLNFDGGTRLLAVDTDGDGSAEYSTSYYLQVSQPDPGGNLLPVANAGSDRNLHMVEGAVRGVMLDGIQSYDPEGGPLTYSWNFDYCRPWPCPALLDADTANPYFYVEPGQNYRVVLKTYDQGNLRDVDLIRVNALMSVIFYPPIVP